MGDATILNKWYHRTDAGTTRNIMIFLDLASSLFRSIHLSSRGASARLFRRRIDRQHRPRMRFERLDVGVAEAVLAGRLPDTAGGWAVEGVGREVVRQRGGGELGIQ
jgi:hypothetical protein